jgi:hypothetical protein
MKPSSQSPRAPSNLSKSLQRHLNAYALAASAAGVGVLALSHPAGAKIVYTPADVVIGKGNVLHYKLDLTHDGINDFSFSYPGTSGGPHSGALMVRSMGKGNKVVWRTSGSRHQKYYPADLAAGKLVGAKQRFGLGKQQVMAEWNTNSGGSATYRGNWIDVKSRYLGLEFLIKGKVHYGWARLSVSTRPGDIQGTLTGYAYENVANKPIVTGKTKGPDVITIEPASLGRLAQGSAGRLGK